MIRCNKCKLSIKSNRKSCPLCNERLEIVDSFDNENEYPSYSKEAFKKNLFNRIVAFSAITISIISVIINLVTRVSSNNYWSIYVVSGIIYLWILLKGAFFSKGNIAMKLVVQVITLSVLSYLIDKLSHSNRWS